MVFNSFAFALLFVVTLVLNYSIPARYRVGLLLCSSSIFIGFYHLGFLAVALGIATLSFLLGRWIDSKKEEKTRMYVFRISVFSHLILLGFFKYIGFLDQNIGYLIQLVGGNYSSLLTDIFLPLGISFYTFQSISYLVEIYWEEIEPEKSYTDFLLYMLFFMKFLSGPIERPQDFIPQLKQKLEFDYEKVSFGVKLMCIGFFKKLVIADRLAPVLNDVFGSVQDYSGAQLLMATLLYPLQLYADFSGYTDIAIGGASMLGFQLSPNFNRPFLAKSITDFWRRWHMSLSFWVRDYIYEPLAAEKRYWGIWGILFSLFVTFILLGLWHGGNWNFVIYGAIQGLVICYEMKFGSLRKRFGQWFPNSVRSFYGVVRTYLIFSFSLLFFRLAEFSDVAYMIQNFGAGIQTNLHELNLGLFDHDLIVLAVAVVLMFSYESANARVDLLRWLDQKPAKLRWACYYAMVIIIFAFGEFGTKDFIYFQF
ncbi:MAG: MBOAT family protein [Marinifilaceae bacterium]